MAVDPALLKTGDNRIELRRDGNGALYYGAMLDWTTSEEPVRGASSYRKAERSNWRVARVTDSDGHLVEQRHPWRRGRRSHRASLSTSTSP